MSKVDFGEVPELAAVSGMLPEQILSINNSMQVDDFIHRNDIAALIHKAVMLIRELFPKLCAIQLEVSSDPEEAAEWIILRVASGAPRAELTSAYRQYVRRWVRETPPEKRHLVRHSYTSV